MLNSEYADKLLQLDLFRVLDEASFQQMLATASIKTVKKGTFLFRKGDAVHALFFVVEGSLKLLLRSPNGGEKILKIIQPNHLFAEATLVSKTPIYPIDAVAIEPTKVIALSHETCLQLMESHFSFSLEFMRYLSQRIHFLVSEIEQLSVRSATYRLGYFLLDCLAHEEADQQTIALPAPKNLLASQLSIQPESFSRILKQLSKEQLIQVTGTDITIFNKQRLKNYLMEN